LNNTLAIDHNLESSWTRLTSVRHGSAKIKSSESFMCMVYEFNCSFSQDFSSLVKFEDIFVGKTVLKHRLLDNEKLRNDQGEGWTSSVAFKNSLTILTSVLIINFRGFMKMQFFVYCWFWNCVVEKWSKNLIPRFQHDK
jgi:hypothetical protein